MEEIAAPTRPPISAAPIRPAASTAPIRPAAPTASIRAAQDSPTRPPADDFRYGPGVLAAPPADQVGWMAEQVWRTGRPPEPPRHPRRLGRLARTALTVALLAASGVLLFLRFQHAPFQVTGVVISATTAVPCGVDVTARITTDGAAGTVYYRWLFLPGKQPPQSGSQSVIAGQDTVDVIEPVEAIGHGKTSERVTLQVTGPDKGRASTTVILSC